MGKKRFLEDMVDRLPEMFPVVAMVGRDTVCVICDQSEIVEIKLTEQLIRLPVNYL